MADMATIPVFACRGCGKAVSIRLSSNKNDPKAETLRELMRGLQDIAFCPSCKNRYNALAAQGRSEEFYKAPAVLYSVTDVSGLDYYRKAG